MVSIRLPILVALALGLVFGSCGGDDTEPPSAFTTYTDACNAIDACREPRVDPSLPTETIFRVLVSKTAADEIAIEVVEQVEVTRGSGVPVGPLSASHVLVGLDASGAPLDSQGLRFPKEILIEAIEGDGWGSDTIDLEGKDVDTMGYVRALPAVAEIAVVAPGGTIVARVPAVATEMSAEPGASRSALLTAGSGHCGHVSIIDGEADRRFARALPYEGTRTASGDLATIHLVRPGPTQLALIRATLNLMPPLLCHSITRIAVGEMASMPELGGAGQMGSHDLIFINTASTDPASGRVNAFSEEALSRDEFFRARFMRVIAHETGHAAEAMLNAQASTATEFGGFWLEDARTLADETIARVRLDKGMRVEWERLHASFVAQGWAKAYGCPSALACDTAGASFRASTDWSATETAEAGAMSRYGATRISDDIAEMVAWPLLAPVFEATGFPNGLRNKEDFACQELAVSADGNVPGRVSAVYTKLRFLQDLGILHPDDVARCIARVGLPIETPGFDFWQDDALLRSFRNDRTAQLLHYADGRNTFDMTAAGNASFGGTEYPATLHLALQVDPGVPLELAPFPRGVYVLGAQGNTFELRMEDAAAGNFDVTEGFALVAEASTERIAGSIFITQAFRLNAPIPVPQVFDPPLIIRFLHER